MECYFEALKPEVGTVVRNWRAGGLSRSHHTNTTVKMCGRTASPEGRPAGEEILLV